MAHPRRRLGKRKPPRPKPRATHGREAATPAPSSPSLLARLQSREPRLRWLILLAIFCAVLSAPTYVGRRYGLNPDGVSYLDMAANAIEDHPRHLINPLWSPLYPALLAPMLAVLRPSAAGEILVAQFLNWLTFCAALAALAYFLWQWLLPLTGGRALNFWGLAIFAFASFFWHCLRFFEFANTTPDLCAAALLLVALGLCCRLGRPSSRLRTAAAMGVCLALAYYARAALFPVSLMLLAYLLAAPPPGVSRRAIAWAGAVFLLVSAPLVVAMSVRTGHPSFSDAGRLNYIWWVNRDVDMFIGWTGGRPEEGRPVHPPRILHEKPKVIEFRQPISGTYPLWYDPAYWNEGARLRFRWDMQVYALRQNAEHLWEIVSARMIWIWGGLLALIVIAGFSGARPDRFQLRNWWLVIWPLAGIAGYLVVHLEPRYIALFLFLITFVLYGRVALRSHPVFAAAVLVLLAGHLLYPTLASFPGIVRIATRDLGNPTHPDLRAAKELSGLGLKPGDEIATVGDGFGAAHARYAGLRIIAQVLDPDLYWTLDNREASKIWGALRGAGARMLVTKEMAGETRQSGWRQIAHRIWVHPLTGGP